MTVARALAGAVAAAALLAGPCACARIDVTSDPEGRHPTGLLVRPARPVVLPSSWSAREGVIASRLAWVPDERHGLWMARQPGLGRGGFAVTLHDGDDYRGYLVGYGEEAADARVPEAVEAAGVAAAAVLGGAALLRASGR